MMLLQACIECTHAGKDMGCLRLLLHLAGCLRLTDLGTLSTYKTRS